MKRLFTTLLIALLGTMAANAQAVSTTHSRPLERLNSVQLELGGHGLFYSLNYERIILNRERFKGTASLGVGYYPPSNGIIPLWMPLSFGGILSFGKHHAEIGIGHVFIAESGTLGTPVGTFNSDQSASRTQFGFLSARAGYRFQKPGGRYLLRASFTPFVDYQSGMEMYPSGGLSVGYVF